MTAQEKAKELVDRFYLSLPNNGSFTGVCNINQRWEEGKNCALIAVDEIMNYSKAHGFIGLTEYYEEIKQKIEKL